MKDKLNLRQVILTGMVVDIKGEVLKADGQSVASHLYNIAKNHKKVQSFLDACKSEERTIKSDAMADDVAKFLEANGCGVNQKAVIPRCYTQAKSNIKAAWLKGITPQSVKGLTEMREQLNATRKADNQGVVTGKGFRIDGDAATTLTALGQTFATLPETERAEAVKATQAIVNKYSALVAQLLADKVVVDAPKPADTDADKKQSFNKAGKPRKVKAAQQIAA